MEQLDAGAVGGGGEAALLPEDAGEAVGAAEGGMHHACGAGTVAVPAGGKDDEIGAEDLGQAQRGLLDGYLYAGVGRAQDGMPMRMIIVLRPPYSGVQVTVEQAALGLAEILGPDLVVFAPRGYGDSPRPARVMHAPSAAPTAWPACSGSKAASPPPPTAPASSCSTAPPTSCPLRWRGPSVLTVHDLLTLSHPEWCKRSNVYHFRLVMPRRCAEPPASS